MVEAARTSGAQAGLPAAKLSPAVAGCVAVLLRSAPRRRWKKKGLAGWSVSLSITGPTSGGLLPALLNGRKCRRNCPSKLSNRCCRAR